MEYCEQIGGFSLICIDPEQIIDFFDVKYILIYVSCNFCLYNITKKNNGRDLLCII